MQNRRLHISGLLAILLTTTMVHTPNKEEKEVIPQSTSDMPLFNICMKVVKFQQKRIFLNRCVKQNVLLRSQLKKGVDYDLLIAICCLLNKHAIFSTH